MKRFTILESTIIGFFIGVVVSTYIIFLDSTEAYISPVLDYVSLRPLLTLFFVPSSTIFVAGFIYVIFIFTCYGLISGFLIKKSDKALFFIMSIALILTGIIIYQQITGVSPMKITPLTPVSIIVTHPVNQKDTTQTPQQYFGNEVSGDLNNDGIADVAFIISRIDPERGSLYYLASALATSTGHIGTNLIFLGNNAVPQVISITDGVIDVSYLNSLHKTSTTTKDFYAKVVGGILEQITQK